MAFCGNCGTQAADGVKFCPGCGGAIGANAAPEVPAQPAQDPARDAADNKTMGILAYILFFVPLLTGAHKTSPYVKFHTNQGTVLFIASIAFSIVYSIVRAILRAIFWSAMGAYGLWSVLSGVLSLLFLLPTVLCIIGIVNAAKGEQKPLPVIGKFKIIK